MTSTNDVDDGVISLLCTGKCQGKYLGKVFFVVVVMYYQFSFHTKRKKNQKLFLLLKKTQKKSIFDAKYRIQATVRKLHIDFLNHTHLC